MNLKSKINKILYVYILKLTNNKYYIGKTNNFVKRIDDHINLKGCEWTKLYKPIKIINMKQLINPFEEDMMTLDYMSKYGVNNVRGGSFSKISLSNEDIITITKMIRNGTDRCFICGSDQHFMKNCGNK